MHHFDITTSPRCTAGSRLWYSLIARSCPMLPFPHTTYIYPDLQLRARRDTVRRTKRGAARKHNAQSSQHKQYINFYSVYSYPASGWNTQVSDFSAINESSLESKFLLLTRVSFIYRLRSEKKGSSLVMCHCFR
jgi:hypothetical protein